MPVVVACAAESEGRHVRRFEKIVCDVQSELLDTALDFFRLRCWVHYFGDYLSRFQNSEPFRFRCSVLRPPSRAGRIGLAVIAVGRLAHWFKQKNLQWYGRIEVMFASGSAFFIGMNTPPPNFSMTQWAALVGCTFVAARGFNNMDAILKDLNRLTEAVRNISEKILNVLPSRRRLNEGCF
jgi:hypothetical protein